MSVTVACILTGGDELSAKLRKIDKVVRGSVALNAVEAGAALVEGFQKVNIHDTFSENQTGGLSNSVTVESRKTGEGAEATVGPIKVYARIQEFGGTIRPIHGKYLKFRIENEFRMAKEVHLPARPYVRPSVTDHKSEILSAMAVEIDRGMKR